MGRVREAHALELAPLSSAQSLRRASLALPGLLAQHQATLDGCAGPHLRPTLAGASFQPLMKSKPRDPLPQHTAPDVAAEHRPPPSRSPSAPDHQPESVQLQRRINALLAERDALAATHEKALTDAFESFKLGILRHKTASWQEVSCADVLRSLDALKALATAPA